jgi:hypothetical protein
MNTLFGKIFHSSLGVYGNKLSKNKFIFYQEKFILNHNNVNKYEGYLEYKNVNNIIDTSIKIKKIITFLDEDSYSLSEDFYFIEDLSYNDKIIKHNVYANCYNSKMNKNFLISIDINNLYLFIECSLNKPERKTLYSKFF